MTDTKYLLFAHIYESRRTNDTGDPNRDPEEGQSRHEHDELTVKHLRVKAGCWALAHHLSLLWMRAQSEFTDYLPVSCFPRVNLSLSQRWFEHFLNGTSQVRSSSVLKMLGGHFDVLAGGHVRIW